MKSTYKVIYTDIQDRPAQHLPKTWATNFSSSKRAFAQARRLHKENRTAMVIELSELGMLATWELPAGENRTVFNCDEALCEQFDNIQKS